MLKKSISVTLVLAGWLMVNIVTAGEECIAAVDAADSMNVNQKPCDYSDKGLNGVLHKAFAKQSKANAQTAIDTPGSITDSKSPTFLLRTQTDQWSNTQLAKTQLLPQALAQCETGFRIVAEEYRPLKMGRIEITLQCICL